MEKKLKIIIADDSAEFGQSCAKALRGYGMDVVLCEKDGNIVLEKIKDYFHLYNKLINHKQNMSMDAMEYQYNIFSPILQVQVEYNPYYEKNFYPKTFRF